MRAVSLTYSGAVGVPIDDVFELISDAARMPEWLPYCTSAVPSPTKKGKGDRHRLTFENQARKTHIVIEIIEYVPPTTLGWVEIVNRRGSKTFFKLQFAGGTTHVTMKHVWTPISPARQSRYGTSTVSPSFATIVSLKTSRASLTSSSALIE